MSDSRTGDHRFVEFCDACREFRYIGLCYEAPGIGKTLSALRYSRDEMILKAHREPAESRDQLPIDIVLYTTAVVNTPARVQFEIRTTRERVKEVALRPIHREATDTLDAIRVRDEARRAEIMNKPGCSPCDRPAVDSAYFQTFERFQALKRAVPDPTTLILLDEADRLHMNSLEVIRSIFDEGGIGIVLIGMPGIEKRVARFPQFYSRISFVHEFRPLDEAQMTNLLKERWLPSGVKLPDTVLAPDVIASLIRTSGGNFRLLTRLLTQVERILKVNQVEIVSKEIGSARQRQPGHRTSLISNATLLRQIALKYLCHIAIQATHQNAVDAACQYSERFCTRLGDKESNAGNLVCVRSR